MGTHTEWVKLLQATLVGKCFSFDKDVGVDACLELNRVVEYM